ncbi:MAG TPA: OmpA family protein [Terriglobales bacterium]
MNYSPARLTVRRGTFSACLKLATVVLLAFVCSACGSKPVAKLPPPPPPPVPTATVEAAPSTLQPGQSAVLTWKTENATDIKLEPIGTVEASGSKTVTPSDSVTYRIVAKGPGGQQEASVRVTVMPAATAAPKAEDELFSAASARQDVFFDTDEYSVRADQEPTVVSDASFLKAHPDLHVLIEGHCDELGSIEYNLALGESRAQTVKSMLVKAGISPMRIATISYGKERPFCREESDQCYRQNRRAHIVPTAEP